MIQLTKVIKSFPSTQIPNRPGHLPVEVSLIAQLGHGAGSHLYARVTAHQRMHENFMDELDEPSAKLADIDFELQDFTALYSFAVGPKGHPFHRHAGHRIFTAISGSGGAQLRFSTTPLEEIEKDPHNFIRDLHFINIPPDCLFTARFGGETWHQFYPLSKNTLHPVFFALSCHTNELGGNLSEELKEKILAHQADIPSLTEVLPNSVHALLNAPEFQKEQVPITTLSFDAPAGTTHRAVCDSVRGNIGILRQFAVSWYPPKAYISQAGLLQKIEEHSAPFENSLLKNHLIDAPLDHDDTFSLRVKENFENISASNLLEKILEGFLENAPTGVTRLMLIRNILVKPLGLRTSPLGCPVSSLLSDNTANLFANQYPVWDQNISDDNKTAQVILGANDKHLKFRSCISVQIIDEKTAEITMGTRVHCLNAFGKFYIGVIDYVHRKYISPKMLSMAVDYALRTSRA